MSGFVVVCGDPGGPPIRELIGAIRHRGDGEPTFFADAHIHLAHVHRATTAEAALERHPLQTDAGLVVAADARLDNRDALIDALGGGRDPAEVTDLELIAEAYRRYGDLLTEHLLGDFAFVVWDSAREHLLVVRDHLGVRPAFYAELPNGGLAVASEAKALATHPAVAGCWRVEATAAGLVGWVPGRGDHPLEGIQRLPPGHRLSWDGSGAALSRYWAFDEAPPLERTPKQAAAEFRELFTQAVQCRLRTNCTIASHLSGGLDSSAVSGVASALRTGQDLVLLTNAFPNADESDETDVAGPLGEALGHDHLVVDASAEGPLKAIDHVCAVFDEPYVGSNHHLVWLLTRTAADNGASVVLDGFDGDAIVSHGYELMDELAAEGKWDELARTARSLAERRGMDAKRVTRETMRPELRRSLRRIRVGRLFAALRFAHREFGHKAGRLFAGAARAEVRALRDRVRSHPESSAESSIPPWMRPNAATALPPSGARDDASDPPTTARAAHLAHLPPDALGRTLEWLDQYTAAAGIEARHPFLDVRVVEFCVGVGANCKLKDGFDRWLVREAMAGVVPDDVRWRTTKTSMHAQFVRGLLELDRPEIEARGPEYLNAISDLIDPDAFWSFWNQIVSGEVAPTSPRTMALWRTLVTGKLAHSGRHRRCGPQPAGG